LGFLRSAAATRLSSGWPCFPLRPFFFFLGSREPEASVVSAFCFPLAVLLEKIAPTASSPEAKLVAMSSSWLVLVGVLRPSSCTSSLQVVPEMKAQMTSESVMLGSSVHCLEKRLMKSQRDSSGFCRQPLRSQEFSGRTYVPWKFPTKILTRSAQS
jgi:hypothetical protein